MTTKTEQKQLAQDALMSAMQTAFSEIQLADWTEMSKQMARVERLFGYAPFSFTRGV